MPDPEPRPSSEPSEATGSWQGPGPSRGAGWSGGDSPTVRTGSSARGARSLAGPVSIPLPHPGDRIDTFELEEAIGVGGMGAVFRALDGRLDRHVALKILPPEQAGDPETVQRFYQEGRAAARLDHENIARVYTIGHDGRFHYIAFEYIEGTTIRQRVERNGPLEVGEAINYTLQIAGALVHAVERGVVHRDIKPSNIIVTPQGRAKLVDMGLARRFERGGDDGLTQSGMTLGTFDYISPEQARDPRDVDVRSDLYSLGCTLFHMLTGRPPFPEGTVLQKLLQHQEEAPPDIRELNPHVTPDLASIVAKLMAKDRDRRYQTPEQLVRDLLTVAGALGLRSLSPEGLVWMSSAPQPSWERHLIWGIPTAALVLVVAGLVWFGQEPAATPFNPPPDSFAKEAGRPARPSPPDRPKGAAPPPTDASPEEPRAVAAAPRDIPVDSNEDLMAVLASAPPRSIVVLSDDGPYLIRSAPPGRAGRPSSLRADLTIKADAGARPVLRLAREAPDEAKAPPAALLDLVGGRVTLEGLEFVVDAGDRDEGPAAVRTQDTELTLRRCLFRRTGPRPRRDRPAALHVRSSPTGERPAEVHVESCHFDGNQVGVLADGPAEVVLRDCTMAAAEPAVWFDNPRGGAVPAALRLQHDSLLAGDGPVFRFDGTAPRVWVDDSVIAPPRDLGATLVATDRPDLLDWRGRANLYAGIGTFLQPSDDARGGREPVHDWASWESGRAGARETGSSFARGRVWDEPDVLQALAQETQYPTRAFRLAPAHPGDPDLGVRQGPGMFGAPAAAGRIATSEPRRDARPSSEPSPPRTPEPAMPPDEPPARTKGTPSPGPGISAPSPRLADMPDMPVMPPMDRENEPAKGAANADSPPEGANPRPEPAAGEAAARPPANPEADPGVIRTADQFVDALSRRGSRGGTLVLAADADWDVAGVVVRTDGRWVVRAEPGPSRPRIRFRPDPAGASSPIAWMPWIDLRAGALQIEGIDIILPEAHAPRRGRWAAFGVTPGSDLSLTNCTVTIEGGRATSAVVTVEAGEAEDEPEAEAAAPPAATVWMTDCLLRSGGDLVAVAAGRRADLELSNAVVATEGSLVHAHGRALGLSAEPIRLTLRQVTARTVGGLVQLESAPGEPELPKADVVARDSILATTPQGAPLFRVDGQDVLTALRDRIAWEGHGVAYHQILAYRRDQTALAGVVPTIYDRTSWQVAVGTKEASPWHGDVKFRQDWDPDRPLWSLRRDDVRLAPDSPVASNGPDLQRIPAAPSGAES
jgi:eukaryotic-like serine/threonine-protein kinase